MATSLKENLKYRSWVEVDLGHFAANWAEMKRLVGPDVKILQVVKADAYGHGAIEISNAALKNGASCLGVANADEGVQLRVSGITAPILILSPATDSEIDQIIKYNLIPSVSDLGFAREFQKKAHKAGIRAPIHVEVDTGMGRGGTIQAEACQAIREIASFPNLSLEGIFTHFSESEILSYYNDLQWRSFREILETVGGRRPPDPDPPHLQQRRHPELPGVPSGHGAAGDHVLRHLPLPGDAGQGRPRPGDELQDAGGPRQGVPRGVQHRLRPDLHHPAARPGSPRSPSATATVSAGCSPTRERP